MSEAGGKGEWREKGRGGGWEYGWLYIIAIALRCSWLSSARYSWCVFIGVFERARPGMTGMHSHVGHARSSNDVSSTIMDLHINWSGGEYNALVLVPEYDSSVVILGEKDSPLAFALYLFLFLLDFSRF